MKKSILLVILLRFLYRVCTGYQEEGIDEIANSIHRRTQSEGTTQIAWLLSFPNSGTTYTERLVQIVSQRSVASNYGHEVINEQGNVDKTSNSLSVFPNSLNGPFRTAMHLPLPEDGYTLTKTHCGGYCFSECPPSWYRLSPLKFLQECRLGMRHEETNTGVTKETWVQYDYLKVQRTIHLIRNPFENIVARFFHEHKVHALRSDTEFLSKFSKSPEGFRAWCKETDEKWKFHEITVWGKDVYKNSIGVPCHGELMRIVRWHNNAFALHPAMAIPVLILHYNDFANDFDGTLDKIMKFLNLPPVADPVPFLYSNHDEYYKPWERVKMSEFIQYVATDDTLSHLERYLATDLQAERKKLAESLSSEKNSLLNFLFFNVKHNTKDVSSKNEIIEKEEEKSERVVEKEEGMRKHLRTHTKDVLFFNLDIKTTQNATMKQRLQENTKTNENIMALVNNDWQNNKEASPLQKYSHVQAALQRMTYDWESSKTNYTLRYHVKVKN